MQINVMKIEVLIRHEWIPFSVFEEGKYAGEIKNFIEEASGQQDQETEAMMLAEALGTDIRFVDKYRGIAYQVKFQRGERTSIVTTLLETDRILKIFAKGGHIPECWEAVLGHVINI